MTSFPIGDWQFWMVTAAAMTALWKLLRPLLPRPWRGERAPRPTRATLTIKGKSPEPPCH